MLSKYRRRLIAILIYEIRNKKYIDFFVKGIPLTRLTNSSTRLRNYSYSYKKEEVESYYA